MARKKINLKLSYDAPVTLTFSLVCIVVYLLDTFLLKSFLTNNILSSPTTGEGAFPFVFSNFASYPRLVLYVFSSKSISLLLANTIFILMLGPSMEERYGSVVVGIMIAVSALFAGVLNACFCKNSLQGSAPIVFMMIFLNAFMAFTKKKLPISFICIIAMYIAFECIQQGAGGIVGVIINVAGGLCGSLFAFLTSPKARAESRYNKKIEEVDSASPRFKKDPQKRTTKSTRKRNDDRTIVQSNDNDETIVGTLKF